jgi:hypothetical protein
MLDVDGLPDCNARQFGQIPMFRRNTVHLAACFLWFLARLTVLPERLGRYVAPKSPGLSATGRYNPDDPTLCTHCRENLRANMISPWFLSNTSPSSHEISNLPIFSEMARYIN